MEESPDRLQALEAAVRALGDAGVRHALIGGIAVGIRSGIPRATLDVDLAVSSRADVDRVVEALTSAGFRLVGRHAHSINFRHSSGEPVQLAIDPSFDAPIDRAEAFDLGGARVAVVTTDDLIAMKERAAADPGRRRSKAHRDRADAALLRGDVPDPDEGW